MNDKLKKIWPGLALAGILTFHIINNLIWLSIDTSFLKLDSWREFHYSLQVFNFLKAIPHFFPFGMLEPQSWHGVFTGFITAPFYFIFGSGQDTGVMINSTIFLAILILSIYALAEKISGSRKAGVLAAFLVTFYPAIFNHSRLFMLDLPLTAMFCAGLYFLIASKDLTDKKNSLLFGLTLGLGLLTKFNYLIFIIGPLLCVIFRGLRSKTGPDKAPGKNIRYLLLAGLGLSLLFFILRSGDIFSRISGLTCGNIMKAYQIPLREFINLKISWFFMSLETAISDGMSFILFFALLISVHSFYSSKARDKAALTLAVVIPVLSFIFILILDPGSMLRYSMPALPALAVITSIGLLRFKFRRALIAIIAGLTILQFFAVSYGIRFVPQKIEYCFNKGNALAFNLVFIKQKLEINPYLKDKSSHPSRADWKCGRILDILNKDNSSGKHIKVMMLNDPPEIFEGLSYMIYTKKQLISLLTVNMVEPFYVKRFAPLDELCLGTDYLLILDHASVPKGKYIKPKTEWDKNVENSRETFYQNINRFKLLESILLPDNTRLLVYKNTAYSETLGSRSVSNGGLKAVFDSGSLRIFYKGSEITHGLGLFSAVFSMQSWRDSMEAVWSFKKESDSRLTATGRWMFIPVTQKWVIDVYPDKITWQITLGVESAAKIDGTDFKLMLSDQYKEWVASSGQDKNGIFNFNLTAEPWKRVWKGKNTDTITIKPLAGENPGLPSITISGDHMPQEFIPTAAVSNRFYGNSITAGFSRKGSPRGNIILPGQMRGFKIDLAFDQN